MQNGNGSTSVCGVEVASVNAPRLVTGQWLAHAKLTLAQRAYLAADFYSGAVRLVEPTMLMSTALARVNVTYAHQAFKRFNDRALVESGAVPLSMPKALPLPPSPQARLASVVAELGITGTFAALASFEHGAAAV